MIDWDKRRQRTAHVMARAAKPNTEHTRCLVFGCPNPTKAAAGKGLDTRYCRKHADHYERHGSPHKPSYTAQQLKPHRKAAMKWLLGNWDDPYVRNAVQRVLGLYKRAGPYVAANSLRGKTPRERAWVAWARLRKHEVDPLKPLAAWLAVEMAIRADMDPVRTAEFKRVQAAKLVHRMASGTHRRWEQEFKHHTDPFLKIRHVEELHVYPQSRGRVLRYIGEDLEGAAEFLADRLALFVDDAGGGRHSERMD